MKIVYIVLKGLSVGGGIEKFTEEVGSRLAAKGHEIVVYTMKHYGTNGDFHRGMRIKTVPAVRTKSLEKLSAAFLSSLGQVTEKNVDVLHYHAFGPSIFGIIPRLMGRKVVIQGHGLEWKRLRWGKAGRLFFKLTEPPSVRIPHMLTVVSRAQQEYIQGKYGRDSIYIPTGITPAVRETPDLIKQYGLCGGDYILFAGRLVREKGVHYLIDAYQRLRPDLKLVIAGDARHEGKYKTELGALAKGNSNILFTGFVTGRLLRELFSNAYLFVLPSEIEGLPTALLEAMSYGKCCLVSDIPENLEALNGLGYSFRKGDKSDLVRVMDYLLQNPGAAAAVQERAREHVLKHYSWDSVALQFEELYRELMD